MKRKEILRRLRDRARAECKRYEEFEMTRHTAVIVGETRSTLKRSSEIDDVTARKFFDQFADEFGKGWWR